MAEALGVVKVGYIEWLLRKLTPCSRSAFNVGASSALTEPGRSPSATKITILRGAAISAPGPHSAVAAITIMPRQPRIDPSSKWIRYRPRVRPATACLDSRQQAQRHVACNPGGIEAAAKQQRGGGFICLGSSAAPAAPITHVERFDDILVRGVDGGGLGNAGTHGLIGPPAVRHSRSPSPRSSRRRSHGHR